MAGQATGPTPAPAVAPWADLKTAESAAAVPRAAPKPEQATAAAAAAAATSAFKPLPALPTCEQNVLNALGWQQAYNPDSYTIDAEMSTIGSLDAWESLGCLTSLTNLTLRGKLPSLPDAWAANGSFPALQSMNFSFAVLAGSLPASWGQPGAFPELLNMNLSLTQLSGRLPPTWGSPEAFNKLQELRLATTNITGDHQYTCMLIVA